MSSLWVALFSPWKPLDVPGEVAAAGQLGPLEAASPHEVGIEQVYLPQCVLGVSRGPTRLIQSDPRRVWGGWSHLSLSWTPKSSEVIEAQGTPSRVCAFPQMLVSGEGAAAYTGSSTQLERVTGLFPCPQACTSEETDY